MSNYTQTTDFSAKDTLATGDPEKIILGADVDVELAAIAAAVATKFDTATDGAGSGLDADSVDGVGPVATGTYTPIITEVTNGSTFAATVSGPFNYIRIGSMIMVTGLISVVSSSVPASTSTMRIDLPVASNLANAYELSGTATIYRGDLITWDDEFALAYVTGDASNNAASISFYMDEVTTSSLSLSFMYKVI